MAKITYRPIDPFSGPPVGGTTYVLFVYPPALDTFSVSDGLIRLTGIPGGSMSFFGKGFSTRFDGTDFSVTGGRITSFTLRIEGRAVVQAEGVNLSAKVLFDLLEAGPSLPFLNYLLRSNDRVLGTGFSDALVGMAGNDTIFGGNGADSLAGFNGKDILFGGSGADSLQGNAGNDTLVGGGGTDFFTFDNDPGGTDGDLIRDFKSGADTINLSEDYFVAAGSIGELGAAEFRLGPVATDASDRIIYQKSTGVMRYDPDGSGSADAVVFARLQPGTTLVASDFEIIS